MLDERRVRRRRAVSGLRLVERVVRLVAGHDPPFSAPPPHDSDTPGIELRIDW
jgi:hypothetical protein